LADLTHFERFLTVPNFTTKLYSRKCFWTVLIMEEKKIIRSSQHGFTKGKSCLANMITFYDGMTGWVDEGRALDVVYLDFSKAFDTVSHNILLGKLRKYGLDEWSVGWIKNHRITESQNSRGWKGPLWVIQSNPPAKAGSPTASCTGPCPGGS